MAGMQNERTAIDLRTGARANGRDSVGVTYKQQKRADSRNVQSAEWQNLFGNRADKKFDRVKTVLSIFFRQGFVIKQQSYKAAKPEVHIA